MRYVIVDCGTVGRELARLWAEAGHQVLATTWDPAAVPGLEAAGIEAVAVAAEEGARVAEIVSQADAAVLGTRIPHLYAGSVPERLAAYRRSTLDVVQAATVQRRLVLFSSIVVYGDGGSDQGPVTEQTPLTTALDPAAQCFGTAERLVLQSPRAAVLRLPEVVGHPDDPGPEDFLRAMHQQFGSKLPLDGTALVHAVDYRDVAAAVVFLLEQELTGVFNLVPDAAVPPTAEEFLGGVARAAGLPPVSFTGELPSPRRPVSSAKLRAAGFGFQFPMMVGQ